MLARLRQAVISGDLPPGTRLGQDELCAEFGVSQAPVREALRRLEAEGLVEHRPNRGVFVLGLDRDELLEVVAPTRVLLERYAIMRALRDCPDEFLGRLEELVKRMGEAVAHNSLEELNDLDMEFHELPIVLTDQSHTLQLWSSIMPRLRAEFTRLAPVHRDIGEILEEHMRLLTVIRTRNARKIEAALREHAIDRTRELLDQRDSAAAV